MSETKCIKEVNGRLVVTLKNGKKVNCNSFKVYDNGIVKIDDTISYLRAHVRKVDKTIKVWSEQEE